MDEQSHKDEMRAALRGDFERLRARQKGIAVPRPAESATSHEAAAEPAQPVAERRSSWVERLLGRD